MIEPRFFPDPEPIDLVRLVALTGAAPARGGGRSVSISGVARPDRAGPSDLTFVETAQALAELEEGRPGACLVTPEFASAVPDAVLALVVDRPAVAFGKVAAALYPASGRPTAVFGPGVAPSAVVHASARLEPDVTVDPGAVIGPRAEIGGGATICANAVIGPDVRIGRGSAIGHGASVIHALVGDRVVIQPGARIGQSGAASEAALGRAILQDDVVIGANAAVDRGAQADTVIGEGTRVDNLVRIGEDVRIGRRCLVFGPGAVAPATELADFAVVIDGRVVAGRSAAESSAPHASGSGASGERVT